MDGAKGVLASPIYLSVLNLRKAHSSITLSAGKAPEPRSTL